MADDAASAPPTAELAAASISSPAPSDLEPPTTCTSIRSILDAGESLAGQRVVVGGWVKTGRQQGKGEFAFLEVNDGSCQGNLQVMVNKKVHPLAPLTHTGTSVLVEGLLKKPPAEAKQRIELEVETVKELGEVDAAAYPLPKTKITLETLRDFVHLRARTNTIGAVARIRHQLAYATHTFFDEKDFLYVHTPIITTSDCEGAGEMFQVTALFSQAEKVEKELKENPAPSEADVEAAKLVVKEKGDAVAQLKAAKASKQEITAAVSELTKTKEIVLKLEERSKLKPGIPYKDDGTIAFENDFFKRQAFLTVSGQLQVETYACALGKVYTFGPTFRAENSHTSRHLAEFWMVEPEIAFANLHDDMDCAESYVQYLCKWLLKHCREDMEFMVKHVDKTAIERLELVSSTPFERISYTKAVEILIGTGKKFENKVEWGIDLASEHERYLTEEIFKKPVIVYNYPKGIKAFYMRLNDDQKTVAAMDVLVPKVGELIGGSQREERLDVLKQRILDADLPLEPYEWYLDLRRFGSVKHSGFGLGFERMILFATGLDNIRDVIPFPRYPAMNPNEQEGAEGLEPDFHPEELQGQSGGEDGRVDPMELFIVPSGPPSMRKNSVRSRGKGPAADGSGRAAQRPRTNEAPEQGGSVAQITAADKLQSKDSGHRGRGRPAKRGRIGESRICKTSRKNDPEFQKTRAKEAAASRKVVKEAALSKKRAKKALKKRAT